MSGYIIYAFITAQHYDHCSLYTQLKKNIAMNTSSIIFLTLYLSSSVNTLKISRLMAKCSYLDFSRKFRIYSKMQMKLMKMDVYGTLPSVKYFTKCTKLMCNVRNGYSLQK